MLSPTVPSPTLYGFFFPKIGGSQPPLTNPMAIISGMGEDTDFKFGWNIHGVHPNKSPLNILEKGERGREIVINDSKTIEKYRVCIRFKSHSHIILYYYSLYIRVNKQKSSYACSRLLMKRNGNEKR